MAKVDVKELLVIGAAVAIVMPIVSPMVPAIIDLGVVTGGDVVAAAVGVAVGGFIANKM
jgi:hypothetical protein